MSVIYEPKGRALEYSLLACNLFTGCPHGCEYCYAPGSLHMTKEKFKTDIKPRKDILERIKKDAVKLQGTDKRVLLCFTCDPYPPEAIEQGVTRKVIVILRDNRIPFQVLTKGGIRAVRDFDLYGANDAFATTLTYLQDDGRTLEAEPGAALPSDRIEAIRQAHERGIETWVSLEPVLDPDESIAIIAVTYNFVDLYKIGRLNHIANDTDWRAFGYAAVEMCEKLGKRYYVKNDLAACMKGIKFHSTDTRRVY